METAELMRRARRHAQGYVRILDLPSLADSQRDEMPPGVIVTLAPGVACLSVRLFIFSCACGRGFTEAREANEHVRGCPRRRKGLSALAHALWPHP